MARGTGDAWPWQSWHVVACCCLRAWARLCRWSCRCVWVTQVCG